MKPTPLRPWRLALLGAATIVGILAVGSVIAVLLAAVLPSWGGRLGAWVAEQGFDRLARRTWLVLLVAVFVPLCRRAGWRGWRDSGWLGDGPSRAARRFVFGLAGGVISMAAVAKWNLAAPLRVVDHVPDASAWWAWAPFMLGSALAVGLFEETLARGILFRVTARSWGFWGALLATSLLFAHAHFVDAPPAAFDHPGLAARIAAVVAAAFTSGPESWREALRFLNLALMGGVLCAFVRRDGTVWRAAGLHAGWIVAIKTHARMTGARPGETASLWFAYRSDLTDGLMATVLLAWLLWAALHFRARKDRA